MNPRGRGPTENTMPRIATERASRDLRLRGPPPCQATQAAPQELAAPCCDCCTEGRSFEVSARIRPSEAIEGGWWLGHQRRVRRRVFRHGRRSQHSTEPQLRAGPGRHWIRDKRGGSCARGLNAGDTICLPLRHRRHLVAGAGCCQHSCHSAPAAAADGPFIDSRR